MPIDDYKLATFIAGTNELMQRYSQYLAKEAHYQEVARNLGPKIAQRLYELGAITQDKKDQFVESLSKSAAAPLELLDTLTSHLEDSPSTEIGTPILPGNDKARNKTYGGAKQIVTYDDFQLDVSKYL